MEVAPIISGLQAGKPDLTSTAISALDDLIQVAPYYHYDEDYETAAQKPVVVLHSSGSTGAPKPITMYHGNFAYLDNDHNFPEVPGRKRQDFTVYDSDGKVFHIFPPFHLAGFVSSIVDPIFGSCSIVLGPPGRPPTGEMVKDIMKYQDLKGIIVPPSVIEQMVQQPRATELFKRFEWVFYAGRPLSKSLGDKLSSITSLGQFYGATEIIQVQLLLPKKENWDCFEVSYIGGFLAR